MTRIEYVALTLLLCGPACGGERAAQSAQSPASGERAAASGSPAAVDSIFTPVEELRRFQRNLPVATSLDPVAKHRDSLVLAFVRAVEAADTAALIGMHLHLDEFAYLYYPDSRFTRPPLQLKPEVLWLQIQQNSEKGLVRLLRRLAGRPFGFQDYACDDAAVSEGRNHLWERCTVRLVGRDEPVVLFGTIFERDGRYKFVSYANDF
ncbi:MAG: hypothetical protein ACRELD_02225 [Longimicrobiales bacterium]